MKKTKSSKTSTATRSRAPLAKKTSARGKAPSGVNSRIAEFFRLRREAAGLTTDEVNQALNIRCDLNEIPLEDIFALTNFLNIPPEDVMDLIFEVTASLSHRAQPKRTRAE